MSSNPKNYFGFTFDEFTELVLSFRHFRLVRLSVTVSNTYTLIKCPAVRNIQLILTEILNLIYGKN